MLEEEVLPEAEEVLREVVDQLLLLRLFMIIVVMVIVHEVEPMVVVPQLFHMNLKIFLRTSLIPK